MEPEFSQMYVVELVGYCRYETFDLVYYLLEDGRYVETIHKILESYENTDHQYIFSAFVEAAQVLAKSLCEEAWVWIHSPRNSQMVVGKHHLIEFK